MKVAISGLGRMGSQIARKLAEDGHEVIAHNRSPSPIDEVSKFGAKAAYTKGEVLNSFKDQKAVVWIMLPNEIVLSEINQWLEILPKNSLIIDGGNSNFKNTKKHSQLVSKKWSTLLDIGTSGGVWGYKNGFSMMVGGDQKSYKHIEPALKTLSQPKGAFGYFGPSGSGHFVKMVHNAIEYGMMESLAEGYRVLEEGPYDLNLAEAGRVWQKGSVIISWLNELTTDALKENPKLKDIDGKVAESGEARWTIELANELNLDLPSIEAAFDVRLASQKGQVNFSTKLLAAMRNKFGGHQINPKN